jgi:hypothetical protein
MTHHCWLLTGSLCHRRLYVYKTQYFFAMKSVSHRLDGDSPLLASNKLPLSQVLPSCLTKLLITRKKKYNYLTRIKVLRKNKNRLSRTIHQILIVYIRVRVVFQSHMILIITNGKRKKKNLMQMDENLLMIF